jgi:hypothetical protein
MSEGPTPEQLGEIWNALVQVQRLAHDPVLARQPNLLANALAAAYDIDHTYAVVGVASYAGGRFEALRELARHSPFGEATITFPRKALLDARPPTAPEPLFEACVRLIEAEVDDEDINALVAELVDSGGLQAFELLTLLCALLGRMVVERDPGLRSMEQLLAREATG